MSVTMSWEAAVQEAMLGDNDALALLDDEARAIVRACRDLYRDGRTSDDVIAMQLATIEAGRPIRLH